MHQALIEQEAILTLNSMLQQGQRDSAEASLFLLTWLAMAEPQLQDEMNRLGVLGSIIPYLSDPKAIVRLSAAMTCRNLYYQNATSIESFMEAHGREGVSGLVHALERAEDSYATIALCGCINDILHFQHPIPEEEVLSQQAGELSPQKERTNKWIRRFQHAGLARVLKERIQDETIGEVETELKELLLSVETVQ